MSEQMKSENKCPVCGSDRVHKFNSGTIYGFWVECLECGINTKGRRSFEEAWGDWATLISRCTGNSLEGGQAPEPRKLKLYVGVRRNGELIVCPFSPIDGLGEYQLVGFKVVEVTEGEFKHE